MNDWPGGRRSRQFLWPGPTCGMGSRSGVDAASGSCWSSQISQRMRGPFDALVQTVRGAAGSERARLGGFRFLQIPSKGFNFFPRGFQRFPFVAKSCKKFPRIWTYQWVTGGKRPEKTAWPAEPGPVKARAVIARPRKGVPGTTRDPATRRSRSWIARARARQDGRFDVPFGGSRSTTRRAIAEAAPTGRRERAARAASVPLQSDCPLPFPSVPFQRLQFLSAEASKSFHSLQKVAKNFRESGLINGLQAIRGGKKQLAGKRGAHTAVIARRPKGDAAIPRNEGRSTLSRIGAKARRKTALRSGSR